MFLHAPYSCFNGAVTFSLRKLYFVLATAVVTSCALQWGRNFFVTEIAMLDVQHKILEVMLQWGRNFFVTEIQLVAIYGLLLQVLQWGRNFFVTEIIESVRLMTIITRFNGAVTFSLRKSRTARKHRG